MLNKLKKSNNEGFTIIEVMIVLAIAGLIILIVLLAVPALQRNGRNTAIKNDASAITAAISEYESNNDGNIPGTTSTQSGSAVTINGLVSGVAGNSATAKVQGSTVVTFAAAPASVTPTPGTVYVQFKAKCPVSVSGTSVTPVGSPRGTAVIYAIELAGTNAAKCIDS